MVRIRPLALALAAAALGGPSLSRAQNKFEKPSTVMHVVAVRWKENATEDQKRKAIAGIEEMAARIPGLRRVWLKPLRVQPNEVNGQPFSQGFNLEDPFKGRVHCYFIEFESRQAEQTYAKHPAREKWIQENYDTIREISVSSQATN